MKIVLYSPDIPQNVGNIARTCAVTGSPLYLVRPLGFDFSTKAVKRAGLDYWEHVDIKILDSLEEAIDGPVYFFSTKGKKKYTDVTYEKDSCLVFGSETSGLPLWVHQQWTQAFYTIPMRSVARSLNLANSVAIVLYEALRQDDFKELL